VTAGQPADPATGANFLDAADWFASLPSVYVAAGALITDPGGRVLLVKPNYRDLWALPGGICEQGEPPHEGCARELLEELGMAIPVGPLLVVNWAPPDGDRPKSIMHLVFDGGTLPDGAGIRLQYEELDEFRFVAPGDVTVFLPPFVAPRVTAALRARAGGRAIYLPSGTPYPPPRP
jgi:ADP-ribose pyrophosphatase YjhB (NUDIX family)